MLETRISPLHRKAANRPCTSVRDAVVTAYVEAGNVAVRRLDLALTFLAAEVRAAQAAARTTIPAYERFVQLPAIITFVSSLLFAVAAALAIDHWPSMFRGYGAVADGLSVLGMLLGGHAFIGAMWMTIVLSETTGTRSRAADAEIAAELRRYFTAGVRKRASTILDERGKVAGLLGTAVSSVGGGMTKILHFAGETLSRGNLFTWQTGLLIAGVIAVVSTLSYIRAVRRGADIAAIASD
jgi:polyferredoxin